MCLLATTQPPHSPAAGSELARIFKAAPPLWTQSAVVLSGDTRGVQRSVNEACRLPRPPPSLWQDRKCVCGGGGEQRKEGGCKRMLNKSSRVGFRSACLRRVPRDVQLKISKDFLTLKAYKEKKWFFYAFKLRPTWNKACQPTTPAVCSNCFWRGSIALSFLPYHTAASAPPLVTLQITLLFKMPSNSDSGLWHTLHGLARAVRPHQRSIGGA